MNEFDINRKLLEDMITRRQKQTTAFRKILMEIQKKLHELENNISSTEPNGPLHKK
ncbi:MAG TPA: hypothetical protein VK179_16235 [Bacteroidales bacterium]|nr:hypothetical protein [Bacteroidales bacterium]